MGLMGHPWRSPLFNSTGSDSDSPTRICITEREYSVSMKEYVLPVTP